MAQSAKFVDLTRTYLPIDPASLPENLATSDNENSPEKRIPVMAYDGYNFMPTGQGYRSYFGLQAIDLESLPPSAKVDICFVYQKQNYRNIFIALCSDGIYKNDGVSSQQPWDKLYDAVPSSNETDYRAWSVVVLGQVVYMYMQGDPQIYLLRPDAITINEIFYDAYEITPYTPTFLNMTAQMGIFKAGGRLGFWDSDNSVAWSSFEGTLVFDPSIATQANVTKFVDVIGRITTIKQHGSGFIIYATKSIVHVKKDLTNTFLWVPEVVSSSSGVAYAKQVIVANPDTIHFAWTAIGLLKIEDGKGEIIVPELYDYMKESEDPILLSLVEGRYIFLEVMDANFLGGQVSVYDDSYPATSYTFSGYAPARRIFVDGIQLTEDIPGTPGVPAFAGHIVVPAIPAVPATEIQWLIVSTGKVTGTQGSTDTTSEDYTIEIPGLPAISYQSIFSTTGVDPATVAAITDAIAVPAIAAVTATPGTPGYDGRTVLTDIEILQLFNTIRDADQLGPVANANYRGAVYGTSAVGGTNTWPEYPTGYIQLLSTTITNELTLAEKAIFEYAATAGTYVTSVEDLENIGFGLDVDGPFKLYAGYGQTPFSLIPRLTFMDYATYGENAGDLNQFIYSDSVFAGAVPSEATGNFVGGHIIEVSTPEDLFGKALVAWNTERVWIRDFITGVRSRFASAPTTVEIIDSAVAGETVLYNALFENATNTGYVAGNLAIGNYAALGANYYTEIDSLFEPYTFRPEEYRLTDHVYHMYQEVQSIQKHTITQTVRLSQPTLTGWISASSPTVLYASKADAYAALGAAPNGMFPVGGGTAYKQGAIDGALNQHYIIPQGSFTREVSYSLTTTTENTADCLLQYHAWIPPVWKQYNADGDIISVDPQPAATAQVWFCNLTERFKPTIGSGGYPIPQLQSAQGPYAGGANADGTYGGTKYSPDVSSKIYEGTTGGIRVAGSPGNPVITDAEGNVIDFAGTRGLTIDLGFDLAGAEGANVTGTWWRAGQWWDTRESHYFWERGVVWIGRSNYQSGGVFPYSSPAIDGVDAYKTVLTIDGIDYTYPATFYSETTVFPGGTFLLQSGSPSPAYPTFSGAFVYDLHYKRWGRLQVDYKKLMDFVPLNTLSSSAIPYTQFGVQGAVLKEDGLIYSFDANPTDSFITYGKVGMTRLGLTSLEEVNAQFRLLSSGTITVESSLDGKTVDPLLTKVTAFADVPFVVAYDGYVGKWHNISISGQFDLTYLEYRSYAQGLR